MAEAGSRYVAGLLVLTAVFLGLIAIALEQYNERFNPRALVAAASKEVMSAAPRSCDEAKQRARGKLDDGLALNLIPLDKGLSGVLDACFGAVTKRPGYTSLDPNGYDCVGREGVVISDGKTLEARTTPAKFASSTECILQICKEDGECDNTMGTRFDSSCGKDAKCLNAWLRGGSKIADREDLPPLTGATIPDLSVEVESLPQLDQERRCVYDDRVGWVPVSPGNPAYQYAFPSSECLVYLDPKSYEFKGRIYGSEGKTININSATKRSIMMTVTPEELWTLYPITQDPERNSVMYRSAPKITAFGMLPNANTQGDFQTQSSNPNFLSSSQSQNFYQRFGDAFVKGLQQSLSLLGQALNLFRR